MEYNFPIVSVFCPVYNHEKYIKQCLNGFVIQQTNFAFEVIVQDDASIDSTYEIVREYAAKYDFIIPVLHHENYYSKGKSINKNFFLNAKGKYLAICEGDDYWTDPFKLQKQVDFLDENKNIALHGTKVLKLIDSNFADDGIEYSSVLCLNNLLKSNPYATASVMFRGALISNNLDYLSRSPFGDWALYWIILKANDYQDVLYLDSNVTAVYRKHDGGIHSGLSSINRNKKFIRFYRLLNEFTDRKFEEKIIELIKFRKEKLWNAQMKYVVTRAKLIFSKIGITKIVI